MSDDDDLVKQSIAELQDLVRCRCHEAYKGRGLHDPTCCCDYAEALKVVSDRIEELEAENDLLKTSGIAEVAVRNPSVMEYMKHWEGRAEAAEAKLAKAVKALEGLIELHSLSTNEINPKSVLEFARTTLAELTGGKDE